jgi:hypothetical protein
MKYLKHSTAAYFGPFWPIVRNNIGRYYIKQLHNNTWTVLYVELLVIITDIAKISNSVIHTLP